MNAERNTASLIFIVSLLVLLLALCTEGCKPQVDVSNASGLSLPECQGYTEKHTLDDQGYLTLTLITPPAPMPDAASQPKSYLLTFKQRPDGGYVLDHASKRVIDDADPKRDTMLTISADQICLDPGPGDSSTEKCVGAWIKAAGDKAKCLTLIR